MAETNNNSRLEAFCDGVFAVALTLLVIDIKLPPGETIASSADLWAAILRLLPNLLAFLLSFTIVFITWVNHHGTLKLIDKSSSAFIFANGFLLLSIVLLPFSTTLLSEHLFTDHATAAVVVYAAVNALQSLAWVLLSHSALSADPLTKDDESTIAARAGQTRSHLSFVSNLVLIVLAIWFPQVVAFLLGAIWLGWLVYGLRIKHR
jgi:uncharacterized membrane protein